MNGRSVRFRLTVWYAVLLLGALGVFSFTIWLSLRGELLSDHEREIAASAERFKTYFLRETATHAPTEITDELEEYCQALPPGTYLDLTGSNGYQFHYPPQGVRRQRHAHPVRASFQSRGATYVLMAGASAREIFHALELLETLLLSLVPVVVAVACLGGAWMSRRALKPVDDITSAARSIGIDNLAERLPVAATGDELERLTLVWNSMLERLDTAVRTLSQFAADASHELRTPLAVIRTSAEIALRRERTPEAYREALSDVADEAERMTQLVEDLLFLARTEARNSGMPFEPLTLDDVVGDAVNEIRPIAEGKGIAFRMRCEDACPVSGNRAALRRLFLALLDNAVKYSPRESPVAISIARNAGYATVEIMDEGIGISPGDLPHIFERFYRSDKARGNGGHGPGLSLASTIATAHAGKIFATANGVRGAVFTVSIPVR